jgi:hypothetical protein
MRKFHEEWVAQQLAGSASWTELARALDCELLSFGSLSSLSKVAYAEVMQIPEFYDADNLYELITPLYLNPLKDRLDLVEVFLATIENVNLPNLSREAQWVLGDAMFEICTDSARALSILERKNLPVASDFFRQRDAVRRADDVI